MKWKIPQQDTVKTHDELTAQLVENREIDDLDKFFKPEHPSKIKPQQIKINPAQFKKALARIQTAIKNQQKVLIYGDYDADGITATSIIWLTLNNLGLQAQPFIPDRAKHGYGLSLKGLEQALAKTKPELIITVDNGVTALKELEWLAKKNIDVIVTDHHQLSHQKLPVYATVHSTQVCGAGVAWLLMKALDEKYAKSLLDLVAIATVADQVPLLGVNRSFVKFGIELLRQDNRVGLSALFQTAGLKPETIDASTIGFQIAPRINATGRVATGITAVRLLCLQNFSSAMLLATKLETLNQDRQALTDNQFKIAFSQASKQLKNKLIIVHSDSFHEGVIGLLSGKLTEKFYKPSIVVATENRVAKASARSVAGVNITELIKTVETELLNMGGHTLAAGFSLEKTKLTMVKKKLLENAGKLIDSQLLQPKLTIDIMIDQSLLVKETVKLLAKFEPFGLGNPRPVLAVKDCSVVKAMAIGKDKKHLKLALRVDKDSYFTLDAVGWNMATLLEKILQHKTVNLAFNLELNNWNGRESVQLNLKDINFSQI